MSRKITTLFCIIFFYLLIILTTIDNNSLFAQEIYKNPYAPVEKRVHDLLEQMTLEEKIDQMTQDAPENTRLGIPLMQHGECLHGLARTNATVFPQAIALGSTWNPDLVQTIATGIAMEARNAGITHCYSPVLDIARDPRYGRVEECYGEDPYHASQMGVAFIQGLQGTGEERFNQNHIVATAKHFVGYSEPQQGLNGGYVDISKRTLNEIYLPPFEAAVRVAKIGSLMPGHQDLNGVPCHMNVELLNDLLRDEWGFEGFIISDNNDVYRLHAMHKIAKDKPEAALLGLRAGVDMDLVLFKNDEVWTYNMEVLTKAIEQYPEVSEYIDISVGRILKAKFELGLFEKTSPQKQAVSLKENQDLALKAAKQSIILLKNENNLLPLNKKKVRSIAVIGPNSHGDDKKEVQMLQGGYSPNPPFYISILDGLKNKVGKSIDVKYAEGSSLFDTTKSGFSEALTMAKNSDVIIISIGGTRESCGEGADRDDIKMVGVQEELLNEVMALGKPVILVMINGRQLDIAEATKEVPAILEAWYPGMLGGEAIADILFGDCNPSGKITVSFPRHIGQLPVTYLQKPDFIGMGAGQYLGEPDKSPLYHFGYGLSYTTYDYSDIFIDKSEISKNEETKVTVKVTNKGKMGGDEIVQMYVKDDYASVGRYHMKLKGFERISLEPGESKRVEFKIGFDELHLLDQELNRTVEAGDFTIYIGSSSKMDDLTAVKLKVLDN